MNVFPPSRMRSRKLSKRSRLVANAMMWVGLVTIHLAFTHEYDRLERMRLQTIASTAAYAGAQLLPSDPFAATRTAHAYAEMSGIPAGDIVLVEVGNDQRSITVELSYKIPRRFALFDWHVGKFLIVTARADLQPPIPQQLNPV